MGSLLAKRKRCGRVRLLLLVVLRKSTCRELEEQQAGLPPVEPLDVKISQSDTLLPIGSVTAVVGDQIIVQVNPRDSASNKDPHLNLVYKCWKLKKEQQKRFVDD